MNGSQPCTSGWRKASLPQLAVTAGVSEVFTRVPPRRETVPVKRHAQLVAPGMPEKLLPAPAQPVMGRPRKPLLALPCAQMASSGATSVRCFNESKIDDMEYVKEQINNIRKADESDNDALHFLAPVKAERTPENKTAEKT